MRIIRDPAAVTQILRDRSWQMAGPVKRMLGPLLGEGVILATCDQHTQLRKQIGKLPRTDLDAILDAWTPPPHATDLGEQMSLLSEQVIGALFNTPLKASRRLCDAASPLRRFVFWVCHSTGRGCVASMRD